MPLSDMAILTLASSPETETETEPAFVYLIAFSMILSITSRR